MDTLSEPLKTLHAFKEGKPRTFRGFDSEPQPLWLGSNLLQRAVKSAFNFLMQLYFDYNLERCVPFIQARLGMNLRTIPQLWRISCRGHVAQMRCAVTAGRR